VVLRIESGLFFANADHVQTTIRNAVTDGVRAVVLDCATMPTIDVTAARMLNQLAVDLELRHVQLMFAGQIGQVRDMLTTIAAPNDAPAYHRDISDAINSAVTEPPAPAQTPSADPTESGD